MARFLYCAFLALFLLLFSACQGNLISQAEPTLYRPPTAVAASPTSTLSLLAIETPRPTSTPPCTDNLTFQQDVTIPDGTLVTPGQELDKRWQVLNSGTCNWDERYRLKLIAGPEMGALVDQPLFPARSGTSVVVRIIFIAPTEPGAYRSAWQAYNPQGEPFGDLFFIEVVVQTQ